MLKHIVESAAVEKLKGIIFDRYGKTFSIQSMLDVSNINQGDDTMFMKGHDLYIPIQVHDHYFATIQLKDASDLSGEEKLTISYMIKMVLEPEFYNWYLSQLANNAKNHQESKNIVSIFNPHDLTQYIEEEEELGQETKDHRDSVICFESKNPHLIPRLAYEVHEISQRWAFLNYRDIQSQVQSINDLISLGNLTLLIEDILTLSPDHQKLIQSYISQSSTGDSPLLVIGLSSQIESLEEQGLLSHDFANILKQHRLEADRLPRDNKLLQETLEIMLHI